MPTDFWLGACAKMVDTQPIDARIQPPQKDGAQPQPSPIHLLPYELLAEILILALARDAYERPWSSAKEVMALCRVCTFWREVARNTPELWILDHFPITSPGRDQPISVPATQLFLEQSAPLLISVSISAIMCLKTLDLPQRLETLKPFVSRWKSFSMNSESAEDEVAELARIPAANLDNLQTLDLTLHTRSHLRVWECPELDAFKSAPRLRRVTLDLKGETSRIMPMPWAQLTRISLKHDLPQACLDVLACCKSLVSFNLTTKQWPEEDVPDIRNIFLPHLERLTIFLLIWSTGEHVTPFLQSLELPALKSFSLTVTLQLPVADEWFISSFTPELIHFLTRAPNLEHLTTDSLFAEEMPEILLHTPSLTELSFSDDNIDDHFFAALQHVESDLVHLVPKLERLILIDVGKDFDESYFADMIRSRWWSDDELLAMSAPPGVVRLRSVEYINHMLAPGTFSEEFDKKMELHRSQGLELRIY
ncbi:hypothetical protein C8J57DRAFT_6894 [Mycena rebaudengoi]|nr:hypothetical protein C8J57DRAFT_6894 [Mycena rebaudengoi]